MKFVIIPIFCSLLAFTGCNLFSPDEIDERVPGELLSSASDVSFEYACRYNMYYIAQAESQFYGMHNRYTSSLDSLQDVARFSDETRFCPECNLEYSITVSMEDGYYFSCPMQHEPSHGYVINGASSWGWVNPPFTEEQGCWLNMNQIVTCESMYYGMYNCYTDCLDSLVWLPEECHTCPACGTEYILQCNSPDTYFLSCPIPETPNHGFVINGVKSWDPWWPGYTHQDCCRNRMAVLATAESMYYGEYNTYTDSYDNLYNSGIYTFPDHRSISCPQCDNVLILNSPSSEHYSIHCPQPSSPTHGSVVDGFTSWQ
jgi:hypothetical protein